jgi:hypothetical protein
MRPLLSAVSQPTPVMRKAACACGGGCPRCAAAGGLPVSEPHDPQEREADRAADAVMSGGTATLFSGRGRIAALQRERTHDEVSDAGSTVTGTAAPLDADTRTFMEPRFGRSLANVRVHTGATAAASARALGAVAYTVGHDVVFAAGAYAPRSQSGRRLIAHELAHVVQQSAAPPRIQRRVDPAHVNCTANTHSAPDDPVAALQSIDDLARHMALGSSHLLSFESLLFRDPTFGPSDVFEAYRRRFGTPQAVHGGFRNRFSGHVRTTMEEAAQGEMQTLSDRFRRLHTYLSGRIRYRCRPLGTQFTIGGCTGRCAATDFAHSCVPEDARTIVLCPAFWDDLTMEQQAGAVMHEAVHMLFDFRPHLATTIAQRGRNPECYTSFAAEIYGFDPADPKCPPL